MHTLRRIYGRLRAAVDKIICLFDPSFNSTRKGVVRVCTPTIKNPYYALDRPVPGDF